MSKYVKYIIVLFLIVYFGYHLATGEKGLIKYQNITKDLELKQIELEELTSQREELEQKVEDLTEENLNKTKLEIEARKSLGLIGENEKIVYE